MRLMIVAASAAVLGLTACNQQEDTRPLDETVAAEDVAVSPRPVEPGPEGAPVVDSAMQDSEVPPADPTATTAPGTDSQ
ncbi:MAG: hypothetical protein ACK4FB_11215 [Brevundimonas sp.]|uniref:hypothetical protein n=1 Tax=Brevundimonas sp. TaxID=1871086 RepID=UPI00391D63FE